VEKDPSKAFLPYVHGFRGFAILAVVATHVTTALDWTHSIPLHERTIHAVSKPSPRSPADRRSRSSSAAWSCSRCCGWRSPPRPTCSSAPASLLGKRSRWIIGA
jgi:hypothetical protein